MGRDKLKETQGQAKSYPKIDVDRRFRVKRDDKNKLGFVYWDGEKNVFYYKPIKGIFIGEVNTLQVFDQDYGRNGGSYFSTYYLQNNNKIVVFDPAGRKAFVGTKGEIDQWSLGEGLEKFKSRKHLIVLATTGAILDIDTNMVLCIDQMNKYKNDTFRQNLIVLTPDSFNPSKNIQVISKKGVEYLGKLAKTNNPLFANISVGEPFTDEQWDQMNGDIVADMFNEWKNALNDNPESVVNAAITKEENTDNPEPNNVYEAMQGDQPIENKNQDKHPTLPEDDLPF